MTNNQNNQKLNVSQNRNQKAAKARTKRLWVVMIFIAAALTVAVYVAASRKTSIASTNTGTFTVRRDNLAIIVTEGGSIRAHKSIQYKCQVERRRDISEVSILKIVPAGTYVTQEDVDNGMVLVELDSSVLEDRLVQEEMELTSDQESVISQKEAYEIQLLDNESAISNNKLEVRFSLMNLQKYLGGELAEKLTKDVNEASNLSEHISPFIEEIINDPNILTGSSSWQEMKELQDEIVMAEGNLKTAQDTYTGTLKLHDANYVSDLELDRDRLSVTNQTFRAESARVSLDLFMRYDFPKNTEQYLSDYIEAIRQLERTHAQCRSRMAQAQARLSNNQSDFKEQEEQVKELKQQIEYCTIKAKAPGLVVYGTGDTSDMYRAMRGRGGGMSSGIIAEGEVVSEGQAIISMPDTAAMVAEIGVHETEVDKIRTGQPATIVMDAFPDKVLQGEVLEVAPLPDQQRGWMNPDLKVYETLVKVDGSHDFLKSRMSCKVQILVRQLDDILVLPIQVVSNRRGKKVCYVMTPQGSQEREVQTGAFNDTFVQIVEGLKEGEDVLLNPPLFSESTGADAFQKQALPERRPGPGATDVNDTAIQGQSEDQPQRRARRSEDGDMQGARSDRQRADGESPQGAGPPMGMQLELTDEVIDRIMGGMAKFDPERAKELENLRKSDPEKFKAELKKQMQAFGERMRQGRSDMGQGQGNMGQGQGDAEGRQGRRNRSSREE